MATSVLPQPDFEGAAMDLRRVADQFELCPNIPSFDAGAQVARSIQTLGEKLGELETLVREGFQEVGRQIATVNLKVQLM